MGCEICGRNSCCKSFHSLDEQNKFDDVADGVKDTMKSFLIKKVSRLNTVNYHEDDEDIDDYIKLSEVINIIDNY